MIQSKIHDIQVRDGVLMVCRLTPHGQEHWECLGEIKKSSIQENAYLSGVEISPVSIKMPFISLGKTLVRVEEGGMRVFRDGFCLPSTRQVRTDGADEKVLDAIGINYFDGYKVDIRDGVLFVDGWVIGYLKPGGGVMLWRDQIGAFKSRIQKPDEVVLNLKHGVYKIAGTELRIVVDSVVPGRLVSAGDPRECRDKLFFTPSIVARDCADTNYYAGNCGPCILKHGVYVFSKHGQLKGFLSDGKKFVRVKIKPCMSVSNSLEECSDKQGGVVSFDITVSKPGVYMLEGENVFVVVNNKGDCFNLTTIVNPVAVVGGIYFGDGAELSEGANYLYQNKIAVFPDCYLLRGRYVFNYMDNRFVGYINKDGEFVRVNIKLEKVAGDLMQKPEGGEYVWVEQGCSRPEGYKIVGIPLWVKPGCKFIFPGYTFDEIESIDCINGTVKGKRIKEYRLIDIINDAYVYPKK